MDPVQTKAAPQIPDGVLSTLAEIGEEINASLDLDNVLAKFAVLAKQPAIHHFECIFVLRIGHGRYP